MCFCPSKQLFTRERTAPGRPAQGVTGRSMWPCRMYTPVIAATKVSTLTNQAPRLSACVLTPYVTHLSQTEMCEAAPGLDSCRCHFLRLHRCGADPGERNIQGGLLLFDSAYPDPKTSECCGGSVQPFTRVAGTRNRVVQSPSQLAEPKSASGGEMWRRIGWLPNSTQSMLLTRTSS